MSLCRPSLFLTHTLVRLVLCTRCVYPGLLTRFIEYHFKLMSRACYRFYKILLQPCTLSSGEAPISNYSLDFRQYSSASNDPKELVRSISHFSILGSSRRPV